MKLSNLPYNFIEFAYASEFIEQYGIPKNDDCIFYYFNNNEFEGFEFFYEDGEDRDGQIKGWCEDNVEEYLYMFEIDTGNTYRHKYSFICDRVY